MQASSCMYFLPNIFVSVACDHQHYCISPLQVSGWELHCARLAHSLDSIVRACLSPTKSSTSYGTGLDADAVASLVAPTVEAAAARLDNSSSLWKVAILLFPRGIGTMHAFKM